MIVFLSVPGLPEDLVLVSDDEAEAARAKARNPGRCYSFSEIRELKASGVSREEAVKIAEAKMLLQGGALLWLRPTKAMEREAEQQGMLE